MCFHHDVSRWPAVYYDVKRTADAKQCSADRAAGAAIVLSLRPHASGSCGTGAAANHAGPAIPEPCTTVSAGSNGSCFAGAASADQVSACGAADAACPSLFSSADTGPACSAVPAAARNYTAAGYIPTRGPAASATVRGGTAAAESSPRKLRGWIAHRSGGEFNLG